MIIYLLTDDVPDSIFAYVGQTQKPLGARQYEHWLNNYTNPYKKNWINYLKLTHHNLKIQQIGTEAEMSYIHGLAESINWISMNDFGEQRQSRQNSILEVLPKKDNDMYKAYLTVPRINNNQAYWPIHYGRRKEAELGKIQHQQNMERILQHMLGNPNPDGTMKWLHEDNLHYAKEQQSILRDILIQYSGTLNLFYYDLYSKLLAENYKQKWWSLESDFTELWMHGFPLNYKLLSMWFHQYIPKEDGKLWIRVNDWVKEHFEFIKKEDIKSNGHLLI